MKLVVQWRQRNLQKSVIQVQSCCFANQTYRLSAVLVVAAVVVAKAPVDWLYKPLFSQGCLLTFFIFLSRALRSFSCACRCFRKERTTKRKISQRVYVKRLHMAKNCFGVFLSAHIVHFKKFSTWIWRLLFAVSSALNLLWIVYRVVPCLF